jgi:large subunit ribosomal protein L18
LKERAGVETCTALGKELAKLCQTKNIAKVVFDKNGFQYHGRVKAFADGAREGGLQF